MTMATRLIAVFPALVAVFFALASDLGFQAVQIPGAPADAYWLAYFGLIFASIFAALSLWLATTPTLDTFS